MKLATFKYTNAKGQTSDRVVAASVMPEKFIKGIDISELDDEKQGQFLHEMSLAQDRYMEAISDINHKYDVKHNFRQFDPAKAEDLAIEAI